MKLKINIQAIVDPTEIAFINQARDFMIANKDKFLKINDTDTSSIVVEKCYHDETPPSPCEKVFEWIKVKQ